MDSKIKPSLYFVLILLISFSFLNNKVVAQVSDIISSVNTGSPKEGEELLVSAEFLQSTTVSNISFVYKPFGDTDFKKVDMRLQGSTAKFTIPAGEVSVPYIEYYMIISMRDGSLKTYPIGAPDAAEPLQINVESVSLKDKQILILSPSQGEVLTPENFFISISLVKAPGDINISATKIIYDGQDISENALFAGDLILVNSEKIEGFTDYGSHNLTVEVYDNEGNLYHKVSNDFRLASEEFVSSFENRFKYNGNIQGESRNENYNSQGTWYNNLTANFNGSYDNWMFNGYAYITSEEKSYLQPQNRYTASIESDWMRLKVGDSYPQYPSLVMNGKRLRGFSGGLQFGFFNIQASFGEVTRDIEGNILELYNSNNAPLGSDIILVDSAKYGKPFAKVNLGTYKRQLFAVRPSFGSGENFQLGFSYLHAKDEDNSVEFGGRPKENAVFGSDVMFAADNRNILITGQAAVSLVNSDISGGTLTDAEIDSVFGPGSYFDADPDQIKLIKNLLGNFITVNQFIGPLNPQELPSLAAEAAVNLNYFHNSFKASYIYRGNDYESFGQTFLRTDVKGINLLDRIRLVDNKLFISFGYERLEDNLQDTKIATTKYQTLRTTVSVFPRSEFPNITVGYSRYFNNNGLSLTDPATMNYVVDDITNKFTVQMSKDFDWMVRHSASLSVLTSVRDDKSLNDIDANNTSISLSVNSFWKHSLSTYFSFVYYTSEIAKSPFDYTSFSIGGKYKMLEDKLELSGTFSPSFGDFKRQSIDFLGRYYILENFSLAFQLRYYSISGQSNNSIVGLTSRFTL